MASLLRSGSVSKLFSGLKRALTTRPVQYEPLAVLNCQRQRLCPALTRMLSAQRPAESATLSPSQVIDRALFRIDTDIRRTGRIFIKDILDIFNEVKMLKRASSTQSLLLLRCCGSLVPEEHPEVRNKLVQDIWNTLQELEVPLDISHYNTLLRVYLENNYKFSPTEFLAQLEKNGMEPNRVTYQRLIARYCEEGDIDGATKILEFMKEKQLPVGENIFNALIMGHARANDLESAWAVLDVMRSSGLEPTSDSYAALLMVHAEAGDAEGIERTMKECEASELNVHDRDVLNAVYILATHGHSGLVTQMMEKLHCQQGYAHDAMNAIFRLINANCHEIAYKVFSTMRIPQVSDGQPQPLAGAFFIRQLVRSKTTPMTKVVEYCEELKKKGLNSRGLETALHTALSNGRPEEALFLMRVMKDEGCPLRSHYFWPILLHHSSNGDAQKVYDTAKEMITLGVPVTLETLRYYVLPNMMLPNQSNWNEIIFGLKEAGVPVRLVVSGIVAFLLDIGDSEKASRLLSTYRVKIRSSLRKDLADHYLKSGETVGVVSILGQIMSYNSNLADADKQDEVAQKDIAEDEESSSREGDQEQQQQQDITGNFLMDIVIISNRLNKLERVLPLLQEMERRGISISKKVGDDVRSRLPADVDEAVLKALENVCSGNLSFQPLERIQHEPYNQRKARELEQRIIELQNKNLPTTNAQNALLLAYIKEKEKEKADALLKKLEAEGIPLGVGIYVLLVDMYVGDGNLQKAVTILDKLMIREPDLKLTPYKYLRMATLMAQQGKAEDAVKLVQQHVEQESSNIPDDPIILSNLARRLLDYMTEHSALQPARQVLELLLAHSVVSPSNQLFSPFIKAHLANDDLQAALEEFESVCQKHNITPYKQELTTRCISLEDGEKLQKIMDLSIQVHGEMNSLYDMVFSFIESGKVQQARKLVETPGLRAFNGKLDQKANWMRNMGKVEELANLVSVTKDIFDIDRNMMYAHLLKAYILKNDPEKALGIWTTMQEDDHQPSDNFLIELGLFLKDSGREVPFSIPSTTQDVSEAVPADAELKKRSFVREYRMAVKQKDWTSALDLKNKVEASGEHLSVASLSDLVEGLISTGHIDQAVDAVHTMMAKGNHPQPRVFKYLLVSLAVSGKVETIKGFEKHIEDFNLRRRLNYDNLLCTAYNEAGRSQELLGMITESIKGSSESEFKELMYHFPRGGMMGIMEKHPEYVPQVMEIAEKYAAHGIEIPANCVWMHLFSKGRYEEANQIYEKHLKDSKSMLMFKSILMTAEKTGDTHMTSSLMQVVDKRTDMSNQAKGLVYSSWIKILCKENKFEEGLQTLESALDTLHITELNIDVVLRLKRELENAGKSFPYTIPLRGYRAVQRPVYDSSSSSDSN